MTALVVVEVVEVVVEVGCRLRSSWTCAFGPRADNPSSEAGTTLVQIPAKLNPKLGAVSTP